jgi:hypothetical protein
MPPEDHRIVHMDETIRLANGGWNRARDGLSFETGWAPDAPGTPAEETAMTWMPDLDPTPGDARSCDMIDTIIVPRARDLGDFEVRRALPSPKRQMVGPFIFFDQMGPAEFITGAALTCARTRISGWHRDLSVRGRDQHRDSLGSSCR